MGTGAGMESDKLWARELGWRAAVRGMSMAGSGMGKQHLVRLNDAVQSLLHAAKPEDQSMACYLKESALLRALQSLEDSQK